MGLAHPSQKFQDWFTQQWAILWGQRIIPEDVPWLMGPFGKAGVIADNFIEQLAEEENLLVDRKQGSRGLLQSMKDLRLSEVAYKQLSPGIINFYEQTTDYHLKLSVKWNFTFKLFGRLVKILFSNRLKQLSIPVGSEDVSDKINSKIINLKDNSGAVKYTIWHRTLIDTSEVLYSGVYSTCLLPSGDTCVKAVFPLPYGNATVIMRPRVGPAGELYLDSSGEKFGDAGFYFVLKDLKGQYWSHYINSFRDRLRIESQQDKISAEQVLSLWHKRVVSIRYEIEKRN